LQTVLESIPFYSDASCHDDARPSSRASRDDRDALRVRACHGALYDPRRGVPLTSGPSCPYDPRDVLCGDVHPSCGVPPCCRDARDDVHASHDGRPCDSRRKTCAPYDTRPCAPCDDSRWSCGPSCGPSSPQTSRLCGPSSPRDVLRVHPLRRGDACGVRRVPRGGLRGAPCRAPRAPPCRGDDDFCGPCGPSRRAPRGDDGDAPCRRPPPSGAPYDDWRRPLSPELGPLLSPGPRRIGKAAAAPAAPAAAAAPGGFERRPSSKSHKQRSTRPNLSSS
jgi:hypothetical protein